MSRFVATIASLFMLISPLLSQSNDCVFIDQLSNEYKLDLSPLTGIELFYYDGNVYNYTYTVCSNSLDCIPENYPEAIVSLKQGQPGSNFSMYDCWWLAEWDNGAAQPSYNPTAQTWSFTYPGMECDDQSIRNTTINWHCNPAVQWDITSAVETQYCYYQIDIDSMYACAEIPTPYCKWYVGNAALDLTALNEVTIIGNDASNSELVFAYTPCRNATKCDGIDSMMKIENVSTSDGCMRYIGIWESEINGGIPEYDDGIWRFSYNNGENCGELESELYVYWMCDPNITSYRVDRADIIEPCLYDISISSSLACV